jgi:hypothetical protein
VTEPSYLHTEEEEDALITAYQAKEVEAEKAVQGLEKIMAIVVPMQEQLAGLTDQIAALPGIIKTERKQAYQKGLKDGATLGIIATVIVAVIL